MPERISERLDERVSGPEEREQDLCDGRFGCVSRAFHRSDRVA